MSVILAGIFSAPRYFIKYITFTFPSVHPCDWTHKQACDKDHGICNKEKNNEFTCTCKVDYQLQEDNKTCVESELSNEYHFVTSITSVSLDLSKA